MSNIVSPKIYYFKLFIYFFLGTTTWFFFKWFFLRTGPLFQGQMGARLIESSLFGALVTYTRGAQFAKLPLRDYWIVKVFKKK